MKNSFVRSIVASTMAFGLATFAYADELVEELVNVAPEAVVYEVVETTSTGRQPVAVAALPEEVLEAEVEAVYYEPVIEVNGEEIPFSAYSINNFTYVSLLDLAYTFAGTASRFDIGWNVDVGGFVFDTSRNFFAEGYEYGYVPPENQVATLSTIPMAMQKEWITPIDLRSYVIDDTSYVQLNQMSIELGFSMVWDQEESKISIATKIFG